MTRSTEIILAPAPPVFQVALFTPSRIFETERADPRPDRRSSQARLHHSGWRCQRRRPGGTTVSRRPPIHPCNRVLHGELPEQYRRLADAKQSKPAFAKFVELTRADLNHISIWLQHDWRSHA